MGEVLYWMRGMGTTCSEMSGDCDTSCFTKRNSWARIGLQELRTLEGLFSEILSAFFVFPCFAGGVDSRVIEAVRPTVRGIKVFVVMILHKCKPCVEEYVCILSRKENISNKISVYDVSLLIRAVLHASSACSQPSNVAGRSDPPESIATAQDRPCNRDELHSEPMPAC